MIELVLKKHNDIYRRLDVHKVSNKNYVTHTSGWLIGFDNSDHFQFFCPQCGEVALVIDILIRGAVAGTEDSDGTLHFHLRCEPCNLSGQRKIYLGDTSIPQFCTQSLTEEFSKEWMNPVVRKKLNDL